MMTSSTMTRISPAALSHLHQNAQSKEKHLEFGVLIILFLKHVIYIILTSFENEDLQCGTFTLLRR